MNIENGHGIYLPVDLAFGALVRIFRTRLLQVRRQR